MSGEAVFDTVETPRGALDLVLYPSRLIVATARGHFCTTLVSRYVAALAEIAAAGPATGFHDWEHVTGYEPDCRLRMVTWTLRNRMRIESIHILVKHRFVAMGVATASLLVGRGLVLTYTSRAEFEAALRRHPRLPRGAGIASLRRSTS